MAEAEDSGMAISRPVALIALVVSLGTIAIVAAQQQSGRDPLSAGDASVPGTGAGSIGQVRLPSSHVAPLPGALAPVTWLILVDDLHVSFRDTGYLRKLLRSIATELIQGGDSFAIRSSGPSSLFIPLTTDRTVLDGAISNAAGNELAPGECSSGEADDEMRYRAAHAGATAAELLNTLPKANRPAALLYISDGYPRFPADARVAGVPRMAQQSAVTVFTLNPRALRTLPPSAGPMPPPCFRGDVMINSLRTIAEPTGGFAVLAPADFVDALQRIGRAMR